MDYNDIQKEFSALYGDKGPSPRVGYGRFPAVLVVDMIKVFTQQGIERSCPLDNEIEHTRRILAVARERNVPIIFSTVMYDNPIEYGIWLKKVPSEPLLRPGSELTEVDERLARLPSESLLIKKYPSCFFGTDLVSRLIYLGVDTLIIVGCSTSGCVRATAVDACSHGFHTIIAAEAVGDRSEAPHRANLFDIDAKYGDVKSIEDVLGYLRKVESKKLGNI